MKHAKPVAALALCGLVFGAGSCSVVPAQAKPPVGTVIKQPFRRPDTKAPQHLQFEKVLADKRKLVVTTQTFPFTPDPQEVAANAEWLKTQPPGSRIEYPKTIRYCYFWLRSADGRQQKQIWTSVDSEVMNATFEYGTLVYVFRRGGANPYADVVRVTPQQGSFGLAGTASFDHKLELNCQMTFRPSESEPTSAQIQGSIKEKNVKVVVMTVSGKECEFALSSTKNEAGKVIEGWVRLTPPYIMRPLGSPDDSPKSPFGATPQLLPR